MPRSPKRELREMRVATNPYGQNMRRGLRCNQHSRHAGGLRLRGRPSRIWCILLYTLCLFSPRGPLTMRNVGSIPRSDPLAFFLTWTAYGSWLPRDDRGWVDGHGGVHGPEPRQQTLALRRMAEAAVTFDRVQRVVVEEAIAAHCRVRGWHLHAVECRSQHVHVVVTAVDCAADDVLKQFKSWATRALKAIANSRGLSRTRWWTEGGSRRRIFCEGDLASVVSYVQECQGVPTQ